MLIAFFSNGVSDGRSAFILVGCLAQHTIRRKQVTDCLKSRREPDTFPSTLKCHAKKDASVYVTTVKNPETIDLHVGWLYSK